MDTFKPRSWGAPVQDLVKEYEQHGAAESTIEVQDKPDTASASLVRKGLLDPNTGAMLCNHKASKGINDQVRGYSAIGKENYERTFGHA